MPIYCLGHLSKDGPATPSFGDFTPRGENAMSRKPRTFKITDGKPMRGDDVRDWQKRVKSLFKAMRINCPISIDGVYGQQTRSFTAALCRASGLSAGHAMKNGVTPELRTKLRNNDLTEAQKKTRNSKTRKEYRQKLRKRWAPKKVHAPVNRIVTDDWGYHPGVHDGIDVQSIEGAAVFAMVKSKVIDVRAGGWWGKSPSGDVSKGDGIVQLEVLESVGPFKKGMHIGYGHCEHARVRVGQTVKAGEVICLVGLAVTPHIHLMANRGEVGKQGRGTFDPRTLLNYAIKNG